jgi:hypothetical protein
MMIIDAIKNAETEHVVFFLLTAYLEAVDYLDSRFGLPAPVKRLPVSHRNDVRNRARVLHRALNAAGAAEGRALIEEAAGVFNAAWQRLAILGRALKAGGASSPSLWSRLRRGVRLPPHMPFAFGCLALAVGCSLWATTRNGARPDSKSRYPLVSG